VATAPTSAVEAAAGNTIRSTGAARRIPTEPRPIGSVAQREAILRRIARQMPDSGNKLESAIGLQAGLAIGAEPATAVGLGIIVAGLGTIVAEPATAVELGIIVMGLGIIVAEPETGEATVRALGRTTGARVVEVAGGTASETEVYRREQTAVQGEVPLADREAAPAARGRAVREVRRAWVGEAAVAAAAGGAVVAGEGDNR
jgi:hypothetical protein